MLSLAARRVAGAPAPVLTRAASSLALKYSQAAYGAALSKSPAQLNKVSTELGAVKKTLAATPALLEFVRNPTLSPPERAEGLKQLYTATEKSAPASGALSDITKNLFAVLSENGRLNEAEGVIDGFQELVAKYRGELDVVVTSAEPLDKDMLANLEKTLKTSEAGKAAKVLKVSNKVNPAILGGLIIDMGEKTIDLSVSNRVTKLNAMLQES
ncbi:ATP synthase subunit 5, partial [Auriculariales sp. MPI-PUGE-AT-0066]